VLTLKDEPLQGVTLELGDESATTDETGRFVLSDIPAGHQILGHRCGDRHGTFPQGASYVH
jgi:hypothetical protein